MTDTSVDDFLAHHGVKGMKWGHHSAQAGGGAPSGHAARKQAKTDAKIEAAKAAQKNDAAIKKARENLGKNNETLNKAYAQYRVDKLTLGKKKANEIYDKTAAKPISEINKAMDSTTSEYAVERANAIVGGVSALAIGALMIGVSAATKH